MSNKVTSFKAWMEISEEEYEESGRLDVNIKLHVKVMPQEDNMCAYGINRKVICMAETPSDFEYLLEEFIKTKLKESNLHLDKMVIV